MKDVYPRISRLIERIPKRAGIIITWALLIFMTFNMGISALAVKRQTERKNNIPATDIVSKFLDQYYTDDFLNKIYPNMTIIIKDKVN